MKKILLGLSLTLAVTIGIITTQNPSSASTPPNHITADTSDPVPMCNAQGGPCSDWKDCCSGSCNSRTATCN